VKQPFPHGGNLRALAEACGRDPVDILDASASINPLGPPDWLRPAIGAAVSGLVHYPDPDCAALLAAASARYGAPPDELVAGGGTSQLLFALPGLAGLARAVIPVPAYADYATACRRAGLAVHELPLAEAEGFDLRPDALDAALTSPSLVLLASPGNPTGRVVPAAIIRELAGRHPESLFVVDEAFADFVDGFASLAGDRPANLAVLLSLTKVFAIPGLRLGLLAAAPALADKLRQALPPWSVNSLAQAVGERALADAAFRERTRAALPGLRARLAEGLARLGLTVTPGAANYLLARLPDSAPASTALCRRLLAEHGVALRDCANFAGLSDRYVRIAVRPEVETDRLLFALAAVLDPPAAPAFLPKHPTAAIMVQGTTSNAGKSVLCAGLCRVLTRLGLRVAPFKAQNMSLNSGVTAEGGEMGRAQILQARACRLAPDVRMNPVLLKPTSELGSQVIVLGRPVGVMRVGEYIAYKPTAAAAARQAYDSLAAGAEAMVIEGAGSPAEVNLKAHDIVNMAMARHAQARVLLVADIDRGGAYAALAGTMDCLTEEERGLVAGYLLNRFRGDASLLGPANDFLRDLTGKPVLGVVRHIDHLGLPEEDSVSFKAGDILAGASTAGPDRLDIVLIDLPHVSNFTDVDALAVEPDVSLRRVARPADLGRPDAIILPGSRNTLADLAALRQGGLARALLEAARSGKTEVVGLCAGLQMLGIAVLDPLGLESNRQREEGLGLLPLETELFAEKTLAVTEARHTSTGLPLRGYEIHHGQTRAQGQAVTVVARRNDDAPLGHAHPDLPVWGAYLHGIFDADAFRRHWLDSLRARRGLAPVGTLTPYDLEPALDRLADVVEASLGRETIRRLLGL
jgi:cobyric acid synthase CobQ/L-threonine-O-3-phosphate decarboxylase